ncbi:MAG: rod-binding protein [Rhodospirillales bacterium]|nr:rod-binding protein [Rhodospirillales bacterium]
MSGAVALQTEQAFAGARSAPKVAPSANYAKMRKTAEDFEAFFLGQMLQPMFQSTEAAEPFGGGNAERMWRSMQVEELGKAFAKAGGVGLANSVLKEMLRLQEGK